MFLIRASLEMEMGENVSTMMTVAEEDVVERWG